MTATAPAHQIALHSRSRGSARCLLLALALKADESGSCVENNTVLGKLAGMARNHVCRAARRLIELGELVVEPMAGPSRVNRYQLLHFCAPAQPISHVGAEEPSAPPRARAEDPLEAIHRLRAQAWEAFDVNGRPWHYATDTEREAFANSEHGHAFHLSAETFATQAGVSVSATGEIEQSSL